jgi:hypothetical protein
MKNQFHIVPRLKYLNYPNTILSKMSLSLCNNRVSPLVTTYKTPWCCKPRKPVSTLANIKISYLIFSDLFWTWWRWDLSSFFFLTIPTNFCAHTCDDFRRKLHIPPLSLSQPILLLLLSDDQTSLNILEVNQRFGRTYCLHLQGLRVSQTRNQYEAESIFNLMMEATCSSKTSGDFQCTTWHYIQKTGHFITTAVKSSYRTWWQSVVSSNFVS